MTNLNSLCTHELLSALSLMASVNLTTPHCITTREAILYLERFGLGAISTVAGVHWVMSTAERDFRSSILLKTANIHAVGIGKIDGLFCGRGLSEAIHAHTNAEVIEAVIEVQRHRHGGFIFANRVEFDMLYGHRNDPRGFADALEYFDAQLPRITETLDDGDLLLLTQVICYGPSLEKGITRSSFADVGMFREEKRSMGRAFSVTFGMNVMEEFKRINNGQSQQAIYES